MADSSYKGNKTYNWIQTGYTRFVAVLKSVQSKVTPIRLNKQNGKHTVRAVCLPFFEFRLCKMVVLGFSFQSRIY